MYIYIIVKQLKKKKVKDNFESHSEKDVINREIVI